MDLRLTDEAARLRRILGAAGRRAVELRPHLEVHRKRDGTPVTKADEECDELLARQLVSAFPGTGVVSEEGATVADGPSGTWFVDPIDGTGAFTEGLAHWGPTVCLVRDGLVQAGAFLEPDLDRFWYARRGCGAFCNGVRLEPADPGTPRSFDTFYVPSRVHRMPFPLPWPGKVRALGSTAAHLCLVAAGGALVTAIASWRLWDVGAGVLLVEEAGRQVTGLDGAPIDPVRQEGLPFLAGAPTALRYLTPLVSGIDPKVLQEFHG